MTPDEIVATLESLERSAQPRAERFTADFLDPLAVTCASATQIEMIKFARTIMPGAWMDGYLSAIEDVAAAKILEEKEKEQCQRG